MCIEPHTPTPHLKLTCIVLVEREGVKRRRRRKKKKKKKKKKKEEVKPNTPGTTLYEWLPACLVLSGQVGVTHTHAHAHAHAPTHARTHTVKTNAVH